MIYKENGFQIETNKGSLLEVVKKTNVVTAAKLVLNPFKTKDQMQLQTIKINILLKVKNPWVITTSIPHNKNSKVESSNH